MLKLLIPILLLSVVACTQRTTVPTKDNSTPVKVRTPEQPPITQFENQAGQIQVFVCSRGCFQYLVKTDGVLYAPVNLPPEYQVNESAFIFSGELQSDSTMINKPGADDRLVPDFKVRNLKIKDIRPK